MTDSGPTKEYGPHHRLAVTASKHTVTLGHYTSLQENQGNVLKATGAQCPTGHPILAHDTLGTVWALPGIGLPMCPAQATPS